MKYFFLFLIILFIYSCSNSLTKKEVQQYTNQGKEIAQTTAKKLGGTVEKKMNEGGVVEAIPFCNTMSYPLTEQMSKQYNVTIKRTSLKLRNDKNLPNKEEIKIMNIYSDLSKEGNPMKPIVELDKSGSPHFYAPIILQKKCLNCHGSVGKDVLVETDSIIKSHYETDLAMGFKEGDLRGIWSITFKK